MIPWLAVINCRKSSCSVFLSIGLLLMTGISNARPIIIRREGQKITVLREKYVFFYLLSKFIAQHSKHEYLLHHPIRHLHYRDGRHTRMGDYGKEQKAHG